MTEAALVITYGVGYYRARFRMKTKENLLLKAKSYGFSDRQIAARVGSKGGRSAGLTEYLK